METVTKKVRGFSNEMIDRTFITNFEDKEIGVILEAKKEDDKVNYNVKDFYDIKLEKTANEITNKIEATDVEFYRKNGKK